MHIYTISTVTIIVTSKFKIVIIGDSQVLNQTMLYLYLRSSYCDVHCTRHMSRADPMLRSGAIFFNII